MRYVWVLAVVVSAVVLAGAPALGEVFDGGSGADVLVGTADRDFIDGGSGADRIEGRGGDDELWGGSGADYLSGEAGSDRAFGGVGADEFVGGTDHDQWDGDAGADVAHGGAGLDVLFADSGSDRLFGEAGPDVLALIGTGGNPLLDGGDGRDVIVSSRGSIQGGPGDDVLVASGKTASVDGGPGNDRCYIAAGVSARGCELTIALGSSGQGASLVLTEAPEDRSVVATDRVDVAFAAAAARTVWCVASTGVVQECSSGGFRVSGLTDGKHAVAIVSVSDGSTPPAIQVRRFDVAVPVATPAVERVTSPAADTIAVEARALATVAKVRAVFEDGGAAMWALDDPRVVVDPPAGVDASTITIVDPNLGNERVVRIELRDLDNTLLEAQAADVPVQSSVSLVTASAPAAGMLTITGENLEILDRVRLLHTDGFVDVLLADPGVLVTAGQIQIESALLEGLAINQIDAIIALDGLEVVASMQVQIVVRPSDETPPAIETPGDLEVEATSADGASVTYHVSATDDVDGSVPVTCDRASGAQFSIGETSVVCAAEDAAGNHAQVQFVVRVVDTSAPRLDLPATIAVDAPDASGAIVEYEVTATDAVEGTRPADCAPVSGSRFSVGTTIVTCSTADSRGNAASETFLVVVRDVTPPVLTLDGDPIARVGSEAGEEADFEFAVRALDDVDGALGVTCDPASGSVLAPGEHTVRCTATDGHGNTGELEFTLSVVLVTPHSLAEDQIEDALPHVFDEGYSTNLPMSVMRSMPDPNTIVLEVSDREGGLQSAYAIGDFGYVDASGATRRYDTSLAAVTGGFTPVAVPYSVTLPQSYATGVRWSLAEGAGDVRLVPLDVNATAPPGEIASGTDHVLYPRVWPMTHVVATTLSRGVKEHLIARSAAAPRAFSWRVQHPVGSTVSVDPASGDVMIGLADGSRQVLSGAPLASDAAGSLVPVGYEVSQDEQGGTVLTLQWDAFAEPGDPGSEVREVEYPVDIDPSYEVPVKDDALRATAIQGSSDGEGVEAECTDGQMKLRFVGAGEALSPRTFYGTDRPAGKEQARAVCRLPGPPEGASWYGLYANFSWNAKAEQRIHVVDRGGTAVGQSPTTESGITLSGFTPTGDMPQAGSSEKIYWDDENGGAPSGQVNLSLVTILNSEQNKNQHRRALLSEVTRVFIEDTPPHALSVAPLLDGQLVNAGPRTISIEGEDAASGCVAGQVTVQRADTSGEGDPVYEEVLDEEFDGCSFSASPSFTEPGWYFVDYVLWDLAGNELVVERSFQVADPIAWPEQGDVLASDAKIDLEVPQDLAGTLQLMAMNEHGHSFVLGSETLAGGFHTIDVDTRKLLNGFFTLSLVHHSAGGMDPLETVRVQVANRAPVLGSGGNLSSSAVGMGFHVSHATGNLAATSRDASQGAWAGTELAFERAYNHQSTDGAGLLGSGWRASWERELRIGLDRSVTYVDATGDSWPFAALAGGQSWVRAEGQRALASVNADPATAQSEPYQLRFADGRIERFDAAGRLVRELWPMGHSLTYTRGDGQVRVSDGHGHEIVAQLDASGRIVQTTDSIDRTWRYRYDAAGRLDQVTDPAESVWKYAYDAAGRIDVVTDPLDRTTKFTYDTAEPYTRVVNVIDAGGYVRYFNHAADGYQVTETYGEQRLDYELDAFAREVVRVDALRNPRETSYNTFGEVVSVTNEANETTTYRYDAVGNLVAETDAENRTTRYEDHDAFGNPRREIDPLDRVTTYTYDQYGNELTRTNPELKVWTSQYAHGTPQPSSTTDPLGQVREFAYDSTGQVMSESYVDAAGERQYVARATYDDAGQQLTSRDGERVAKQYTYDGVGRPVRTTDEAGSYTENTYDAAGQLTKERDREGKVTEHEYDALGRRTKTTDPLDRTTEHEVDRYGNVTKTIHPDLTETSATYDANGNRLTETDAVGHITTYTYDPMGRELTKLEPVGDGTIDATTGSPTAAPVLTEYDYDRTGNLRYTTVDGISSETAYRDDDNTEYEVDFSGARTEYGYDLNGNETLITDADGVTSGSEYDAAERQVASIDGVGNRTEMLLDEQDRLVEEIAPGDARTKYDYGLFDEIARLTDPMGKTTVYSHDPTGRLIGEQDPEGGVVSYELDGEGRVISETNELGGVTQVERDAAGQIVKLTHPDGGVELFQHDDAGRLAEHINEAGDVTAYEYDRAGRLAQRVDGEGKVERYEYDARGQLRASVDADGKRTEYAYDTRGDVRSITGAGLTTRFFYDAEHRLRRRVEPDGRESVYTYYPSGRLETEQHTGRGTTSYTYDDDGRLRTVTDAAGTSTYSYDLRGNVERIQRPTGTTTYTYDKANRMLSRSGEQGDSVSVTYDGAGRVKTHGYLTYEYDDAGNVTSKGMPGSHAVTSTYDASGRMETLSTASTLLGSATQSYVYAPQSRSITVSRAGIPWHRGFTKNGRYLTESRWDGLGFTNVYVNYDAAGRVSATNSAMSGMATNRTEYGRHFQTDELWWELSGSPDRKLGRIYNRYPSGQIKSMQLYANHWRADVDRAFEDLVRSCVNPDACADAQVGAAMRKLLALNPTLAEIDNLTDIEDKVLAAINNANDIILREYHYDAATGRLAWIQDNTTGKRVDYTYDARGNQTGRKRTGEATNLSDSSFVFDARGRMVWSVQRPGNVVIFRYDAHDRITERQWGTGANESHSFTTYRYDAEGRAYGYSIYEKRPNEDAFQHEAILGYDQQGLANMRLRTVNFGGAPLVEESYFFHFNHRGDTVLITDESGEAVVRYLYTAFGEVTATGDERIIGANPFTYQGQHGTIYDKYHRRYYMGQRWYDPYQARFISPDPEPAQAGKTDGPYTYAANEPLDYIDADGRAAARVTAIPSVRRPTRQAVPPRAPRVVVPRPALTMYESDESTGRIGGKKAWAYSPDKAASYALKWSDPGDYNPKYNRYRQDCTNFVSQALHAGGWPEDHWGGDRWHYNRIRPSRSWTLSRDLLKYATASKRGRIVTKSGVYKGDLVFLYPDRSHVMIVTSKSGGVIRVSGHTNHRKDVPLKDVVGPRVKRKYVHISIAAQG